MGADHLTGLREVQAITEDYAGLGNLRLYEVVPP